MSIHLPLIFMSTLTFLLPPWPLWSVQWLPSHSLLLFPVVCLWSLSSSALHESHFPFLSVFSLSGLCCLAPSHGKAPSVFSQCSGLQNNPVWFPTLVFCLGFGIAASIHHNSPGQTEYYNKASPDLQAQTTGTEMILCVLTHNIWYILYIYSILANILSNKQFFLDWRMFCFHHPGSH